MVKRSANQSKTNARKAAAKAKAARAQAGRLASMEPVQVTADYHRDDDGSWTVTVLVNGARTAQETATSPAGALDAAMVHVRHIADHYRRPVATMHTLDGDPAAWGELAAKLGLQHRVGGDSSTHWIPLGD